EREHLVPTESVIALPVWQQVGVFYAVDPDHSRDLASPFLGQSGILFCYDLERAFLCLIEQLGKSDRLARTRLEWPAIVAQDRSEPDVRKLYARLRLPAAKNRE